MTLIGPDVITKPNTSFDTRWYAQDLGVMLTKIKTRVK